MNNNLFYLDTSAINFLVKDEKTHPIKTAQLWNRLNRQVVISPLNLYEIIAINPENEITRESIIFQLSHISNNQQKVFFDNPTRILLGEVLGFYCDQTQDEIDLRESWFSCVENPNKTINTDYQRYSELVKGIKSMSGQILKKSETYDQIIYSVIILVFCIGIEPINSVLIEFWKKQGLESEFLNHNTGLLVEYIYNNFPNIFNSQHLKYIASYIQIEKESKKGIERGTLYDSLHSVYLLYTKSFITSDENMYNILRFFELSNKWNRNIIILNKDTVFYRDEADNRSVGF